MEICQMSFKPRYCKADGCNKRIHRANKSGLCRSCNLRRARKKFKEIRARTPRTRRLRVAIGLKWRSLMLRELEWLMLYANRDCEFDATFYYHLTTLTKVAIQVDDD